MFGNYLRIALRHINRQKMYSFIIVSGLALGLALFTLSILFVDLKSRYDQFHDDSDQIFTLVHSHSVGDGGDYHTMKSPAPVLPLLRSTYPEIEDATRFFHESERVFRHKNDKFYESKVWYADPNFFEFFSFDLLSGDKNSLLQRPNSVVITKSIAQKYFGSLDPIGQVLTFNRGKDTKLIVQGVVDDIPNHSSLQFDFIISSNSFDWLDQWGVECAAFIKLSPDEEPTALAEKLPVFVRAQLPIQQKRGETLSLFPIVDIHLHSMHILSHFKPSSPVQLYLILGIGLALLLIVSINFMNLSTARYMNRVREVGLRKVVGASRVRLIHQFLGESVLLALIALPLALFIFELVRPSFMAYVGIESGLSLWQNPLFTLFVICVTLGVGLLSGIYPAFFLSSFKPISVLEQKVTSIKGSKTRRALVIIQFTLSIILIIFTLTLQKQFQYLFHTDLGYSRKNVAVLKVHPEIMDQLNILKLELERHPKVITTGGANGYPYNWMHEENIQTKEMMAEEVYPMKTYHVDYGFIESLDIGVIKGRTFSQEYNDRDAYVISESAVTRLGWDDPIGESLNVGGKWGTVIGVVKDIHFSHVFFEWAPSVFFLEPRWTHNLYIRLSSDINDDLRDFVKSKWNTIAPHLPFELFMLEAGFQEALGDLVKISVTFQSISLISLFISCMGLVGLASFTTQRKTKEIGVRRVMGASVLSLVRMLVFEFSLFIVVANVIAIPFALWGMNWFLGVAWVEQTTIEPSIFILASFLSFIAASISVLFQSVKAANANPTQSLRYE